MRIIIITPVYNDRDNLLELLRDVRKKIAEAGNIEIVRVLVVNDGSLELLNLNAADCQLSLTILNLNVNVGHQRAIAIGLSYANDHFKDFDCAVVMDSDGEDDPRYISDLCNRSVDHGHKKIVFAERTKRSENFRFRLLYRIYKLCFRLLTGKSMTFGNFSCIPHSLLGRLITIPDLWNHFSGSVIKSRLPYDKIPTTRSHRYSGVSKMSLENLSIHGLSAVAIYLETVTIKLLILSILGIAVIIFLVLAIVFVRIFTDLAIPGWASSVSLALINIGGILFIITLLLLLMQLNQRGNIQPSISSFYHRLIFSKDEIN